MLFLLRTDSHIKNTEGLSNAVRAEVEAALAGHLSQLQRVEVYLQDVNSHKGGVDTRCSAEARLAGYPPVAVDARATNVDQAVSGAVVKLARALEHRIGRLADRGGHTSASGQQR